MGIARRAGVEAGPRRGQAGAEGPSGGPEEARRLPGRKGGPGPYVVPRTTGAAPGTAASGALGGRCRPAVDGAPSPSLGAGLTGRPSEHVGPVLRSRRARLPTTSIAWAVSCVKLKEPWTLSIKSSASSCWNAFSWPQPLCAKSKKRKRK